MTKEKMSIDMKTAGCDLTPLTAKEYYDLVQHSIHLFGDYGFFLDLYVTLDREAPDFNLPRLYAASKALFGESTTMYDNYKCSFGFLFLLDITKGKKTSQYLVSLTDLKGGINYLFRKVLAEDELGKFDMNTLHKPIENEFSKEEMRYFMGYFTFFLEGFWSSYQKNYDVINDGDFLRSNDSVLYLYGYMDGEFFSEAYEEYDDYVDALQRLKKKNLPYNINKPNPEYPK